MAACAFGDRRPAVKRLHPPDALMSDPPSERIVNAFRPLSATDPLARITSRLASGSRMITTFAVAQAQTRNRP